jgi:hypothetical protein
VLLVVQLSCLLFYSLKHVHFLSIFLPKKISEIIQLEETVNRSNLTEENSKKVIALIRIFDIKFLLYNLKK